MFLAVSVWNVLKDTMETNVKNPVDTALVRCVTRTLVTVNMVVRMDGSGVIVIRRAVRIVQNAHQKMNAWCAVVG
jgi:hypothetical protein